MRFEVSTEFINGHAVNARCAFVALDPLQGSSDAVPSLFTPSSSSFKVQAFGAGRTYYAFC